MLGGTAAMKRFFLVLAMAWLAPAVAHAEPSDADRATARSLAREGYDAQQRSQYAIAADRFSRADALVHAPTLMIGLARAQVGLGRLLEAQETYQRIVREPLTPNAPPAFAKAVEDAKKELAALSPRLAWVTIDVNGASSADVTLDDIPVPNAALGVRRPCDPGAHWVKATAPGFAPGESTFVVVEGAEQTVTMQLDPLPGTAVAVAPSSEVQTEHTTGMSARAKVGIVSLSIGAAGLITGGVAGILVLQKHSSLSTACYPDGCPASESGDISSYHTLATLSTVGFIVGGVGAVAGLTLILTAPKASPVTAYVGPLSAGVSGTF
jgi:hypothetical protein